MTPDLAGRSCHFLVLILLFNPVGEHAKPAEPEYRSTNGIVRVEGGLVAGTVGAIRGVRVFKGIPYAAPPIGDLRWRAPAPIVPWRGVRQASVFGSNCMQFPLRKTDISYRRPMPVSEDCLYLNVWTAAHSANDRRPVLLWIHDGGMVSNGGSGAEYDGEALANKGAIVVTINYRLGIFGMLAHPELSRESARGVSGNYSLLDMIAAIKWVRRNIAAFGGDPGRVTLYGESAGGMAASALFTSPLVKGDIRGVIAGDTILFGQIPSMADGERAGVEFTKAAGIASLSALRRMTAREVMALASKVNARFGILNDGWVLSGDVMDAEKSVAQHAVPIITGITADFGSVIVDPVPAKEYPAKAQAKFGGLTNRFLTLYPGATDPETGESQRALVTDAVAWMHNEWAAAHTRAGHRAYAYMFIHAIPPPPNARTIIGKDTALPPRLGAWHTGEIPYAFDSLAKVDRAWTASDRRVADIMSSYWVNFAATGDPNGAGLPPWPVYGDPSGSVMELGDEMRARPQMLVPNKQRLWTDYFAQPDSSWWW
jgi:para-nitrobenzyl esterase